eukprot:3582826-Pyramimonas_sp.AAC.1
MPWDKVGSALIGQTAGVSIDGVVRLSADNPMPPLVGDHGLVARNFSQPPRGNVKRPSAPLAAPRASDMAGQIGEIAESLQRACCRVFHALSAFHNYEIKTSSWVTDRGGVGGNASLPASAATPADDDLSLLPTHFLIPYDRSWTPWEPNKNHPRDIPANRSAGGFNRDNVFTTEEHATQPRWSALADGRYLKCTFSDEGWAPLFQEDFGLTVIHALGPDGHAFKW